MPKKEVVPVLAMRVLKINSCPSLSGRSTLTYRVVCNAEGEIHLNVLTNSASGQFNATPIPLVTIEKLLLAHPADKQMSSRVLLPVFRSKSSNSPAFLFAAMLAEGLVKAGAERDSGYSLGDIEAFKQAMASLVASDTNLAIADTAVPEVVPAVSVKPRSAKKSEAA